MVCRYVDVRKSCYELAGYPRLASCSLLLAVAVAVKHILHVHSGISAVLHFQHAEANSVPCAVLSP